MFVQRFYDERLAQASYLIGCQQTGEAIVIDPARDIGPYVVAAARQHLRITRVTETHIHADFLSGSRELAARTGAQLLLSAEGGKDWQYGIEIARNATLLHDGDTITMGGVRIDVMHTPGHTPEHLSFIITDTPRSNEPVAIVTGDFVFVGDVGRPDLLDTAAGVANTKEPGARSLYRSLQRLQSLPDHLQVWPGHGAGSACGKALGAMPTSTLGYERRTNWAFGPMSEEQFVASVLEGQPDAPPYFAVMKRLNREGPPLRKDQPPPPQLGADTIAHAAADGVIIDTRPLAMSTAASIPGALNIPLGGSFTKWAGWLLPTDRDLYLVARSPEAAAEATTALASIGLDRVRGVFGPDVMAAEQAAGRTVATRKTSMLDAPALHAAGRHIIDLRDPSEWLEGHLEFAELKPLGSLSRTVADMDRATPIAVHCQGGSRSAIAASLLARMGFTDVLDLAGGFSAWENR